MDKFLVKELLISNGYWVLNKNVVKHLGLEPAFILTNMAEAEDIMSDEDGWFYQTSEKLKELTGMSNHKQTKAINELIKFGILEQKNKGVPMRRYFKINYESIQKLVFKKFKNCNSKNLKTSFQKISNNKESIINKINKESIKDVDTQNPDENQQTKAVENLYKELGLPEYEYFPHEALDKAVKSLGLPKVTKALKIISQSSWMQKNACVDTIFKVDTIKKALNGAYREKKEEVEQPEEKKVVPRGHKLWQGVAVGNKNETEQNVVDEKQVLIGKIMIKEKIFKRHNLNDLTITELKDRYNS